LSTEDDALRLIEGYGRIRNFAIDDLGDKKDKTFVDFKDRVRKEKYKRLKLSMFDYLKED
jgi:hypothetical protein